MNKKIRSILTGAALVGAGWFARCHYDNASLEERTRVISAEVKERGNVIDVRLEQLSNYDHKLWVKSVRLEKSGENYKNVQESTWDWFINSDQKLGYSDRGFRED